MWHWEPCTVSCEGGKCVLSAHPASEKKTRERRCYCPGQRNRWGSQTQKLRGNSWNFQQNCPGERSWCNRVLWLWGWPFWKRNQEEDKEGPVYCQTGLVTVSLQRSWCNLKFRSPTARESRSEQQGNTERLQQYVGELPPVVNKSSAGESEVEEVAATNVSPDKLRELQ